MDTLPKSWILCDTVWYIQYTWQHTITYTVSVCMFLCCSKYLSVHSPYIPQTLTLRRQALVSWLWQDRWCLKWLMVQIIMVLRWQLSQVEHSFTSCRPHPVFTLYSDGHRSWQPLHNHDYKVIYCTHNIPSYHQCQIGEKNYKKTHLRPIATTHVLFIACSLDQHGSINTDQDTDLAAFAANSP